MRSHLEFRAGVADLVDVGQRASVVRSPRLSEAKLLDLLKLHLPVRQTQSHDLQAAATACRAAAQSVHTCVHPGLNE